MGTTHVSNLVLVSDGSVPLGERVYAALADAIVEGRLAPGDRLSDKRIAEELGISRTPVREALQRLTWIGLVEVSPSRYTRVTAITDAQIADTLEYTGLQAGIALQLAVVRMDDAALAEAITLLEGMIDASDRGDADGLMLAARVFVGHLTAHCGNPVLIRAMHDARLVLERNLRQTRVELGTRKARGQAYRRMREAMQARDADAAEHWFRIQHGIGAAAE